MIQGHILEWVCGAPVWIWRWLTVAQWRALPHMTPERIDAERIRRLKLGIATVCAPLVGLIPPAIYVVPKLITPVPSTIIAPSPEQTPVDVPEPATLCLFGTGIVLLAGIRRGH